MHIRSKNYYGFINGLPKNDKRIPKFKKQYKERGFDDTETWSLYISIARYILPRLKCFRKNHGDYPPNLTLEEWDKILDKMIKSFEFILKGDGNAYKNGWDNTQSAITEGLDLFRNYFFDLWC